MCIARKQGNDSEAFAVPRLLRFVSGRGRLCRPFQDLEANGCKVLSCMAFVGWEVCGRANPMSGLPGGHPFPGMRRQTSSLPQIGQRLAAEIRRRHARHFTPAFGLRPGTRWTFSTTSRSQATHLKSWRKMGTRPLSWVPTCPPRLT